VRAERDGPFEVPSARGCDGGGGGDSLDYSREISTESSGEVDFTQKTNTRAYPSDLIHSFRPEGFGETR